MFSLIMSAISIPDQTEVYKPQGQTPYTLRHGLKVYDENGKVVYAEPHHSYLIGGRGHINGIMSGKKLRIDFESQQALIDFVERTQRRERTVADLQDEADELGARALEELNCPRFFRHRTLRSVIRFDPDGKAWRYAEFGNELFQTGHTLHTMHPNIWEEINETEAHRTHHSGYSDSWEYDGPK